MTTWTVPEGFNIRSCPPAGCLHQGMPHSHMQDQQTRVYFVINGDGDVIDPFDLTAPDAIRFPVGQQPNLELRRMLWGPDRRQDPPTLPTGCYEASWGWVHVKPGCRCPR